MLDTLRWPIGKGQKSVGTSGLSFGRGLFCEKVLGVFQGWQRVGLGLVSVQPTHSAQDEKELSQQSKFPWKITSLLTEFRQRLDVWKCVTVIFCCFWRLQGQSLAWNPASPLINFITYYKSYPLKYDITVWCRLMSVWQRPPVIVGGCESLS